MPRVVSRLHFYVPIVLAFAMWEGGSRAGLIDQSLFPSLTDVLVDSSA